MQHKKPTLGVKEFQSSFKVTHSETPNHSKSNPPNISQKKHLYSNQILIKPPLNSSSISVNSGNFSNNENLNFSNNNIKLNTNTNNSLENENNNNNNNQYHIGRWTDEEHQKFIDGILEYGNEWKKVQQIIKTRSSTQARSHAQKFFLRVKKIIKNNGGNFNINEKDKIFENIINNILPNKKGETLTKIQKEKLLSAISSNIKYEGEINERSDDDLQIGLIEEENLKYKTENIENDLIFKQNKNNVDNISKNNNYLFNQRKTSIGQKRKLSKIDSRDKIFVIKKDASFKTSIDITSQKDNAIESNENANKNTTYYNNINLNESDSNQTKKINENNKKNNCPNINNNNNNNNFNVNNINDNYENKNNMNGCIINNYINVTNNYMNNKFICNFCNNDINNNNYPDYYNLDKNDLINIDRNFNCLGFYQCPDKNIFNTDKPFLFGNQFNKTSNNNFNFINNRINNYIENENCNNNGSNGNGTNPFELNFNNFNNENNENEQQISIQEEEFIKLNNNNNIEDNNSEYN